MLGPPAVARPRVPVLLPVALDQTYDYALPAGVEVEPGDFVIVPFGPQTRIGLVWDQPVGDQGKPVDEKKLKAIIERMDVPALPATSLRFAEWVARYTLAPLGMIVRMMMSAQAAFEPAKPRLGVARVEGAAEPPRMTPARKRALEIAADSLIRAKSALASEAACSAGVIDGLIEAGCLVEVVIPERRFPRPDPAHATVTFTEAQQEAVETLAAAVEAGTFSVSLLDGVTGSGKTEVYFEAVARTLEQGRQALIMLPEIALTSQFMDRFKARFGCAPAITRASPVAAARHTRPRSGPERAECHSAGAQPKRALKRSMNWLVSAISGSMISACRPCSRARATASK